MVDEHQKSFLLLKQLGGKKVAAMHQSPLPLSEKSIFAAKSRKVQLEQKLHRLGTSNTVLCSTTMKCVLCLVFHSSASNFTMNCTAIYSRIDLQLTSVYIVTLFYFIVMIYGQLDLHLIIFYSAKDCVAFHHQCCVYRVSVY